MSNIIITGTSQGIGLVLTQLALEEGHRVLAVARHVSQAQDLQALKTRFPQLTLLEKDLREEDSQDMLKKAVADWSHVDILINNAGVYADGDGRGDFADSFLVNTTIPFQNFSVLKPKLKASLKPLLINISSRMGAIGEAGGGSYAYRSSKAALNMLTKCVSVDEPWLTTVVFHPGWVQTRMGGKEAPVTPLDSAKGMWREIQNLKPSMSGSFIDFRGTPIGW